MPKVKAYAIKTLLLYVAFVNVLPYRLCFFFPINYTVFVTKITVHIHIHIYLSCSPPLSLCLDASLKSSRPEMFSAAVPILSDKHTIVVCKEKSFNFWENGSYCLSALWLAERGGCGVTADAPQAQTKATAAPLLPLVRCHTNSPSAYADSYLMVI